MEYARTKSGAIQFRKPLPDGSFVVFQASNIRRTSSGVNARIKLAHLNGKPEPTPLAGHTYNIENAKDTLWLAGKAHSKLDKMLGKVFVKDTLEDDLTLFLDGLWAEYVGDLEGGFYEGESERRKINFLLEPFVLPEAGTILFAPPKRGKSYVGLLMAVSIDAGVSRVWHVPQSARALYINLERSPASMQYRLGRVNEALGLDPKRPLLFLHARGKSLHDVHDAALKMVREHNVQVTILDSLSRAGVGKMADDAPANSAMDMMNALGKAWIVLGHTPRAEEGHVYGSQMFDAAADILVQQLSEQSESKLIVGLQMKPSNDVPTAKLADHLYTLEFDDFGLRGIRRADTFEAARLLTNEEDTPLNRVVAHLSAVGEDDATSTSIATGVNRSNVATWFTNRPEFEFSRKDGKRSLYRLVDVSRATHEQQHEEQERVVLNTSYRATTHQERVSTTSQMGVTAHNEDSPF